MYEFEMINLVILPVMIIYVLLFFMLYAQKYIRIYTRNKILQFTREEVKEKRKEIDKILAEFQVQEDVIIPWREKNNNTDNIVRIFSLYNEMAVGINEGMYDEVYIRMVMGYDMMDFYKINYKMIVSLSDTWGNSSRFLPLELLLKKWDSDTTSFYRFNKYRRYL